MEDSTPTPQAGTAKGRLGLIGLAAAGLLAGGVIGLSGMASAATPTPSPAPSAGTGSTTAPADDPLCDHDGRGPDSGATTGSGTTTTSPDV